MFCPNTSDPHIKAEFDRYAELLGSNKIAGLLYHKNNNLSIVFLNFFITI